jgi:hypothetical protein
MKNTKRSGAKLSVHAASVIAHTTIYRMQRPPQVPYKALHKAIVAGLRSPQPLASQRGRGVRS